MLKMEPNTDLDRITVWVDREDTHGLVTKKVCLTRLPYRQVIQEENMNKFIDPKNPHTVGKSLWNLGNHVLVVCFILALLFVVYASYK